MSSSERLSPWWLRVGVLGMAVMGCSASADTVREADPEVTVPTDFDSIEWQVEEPLVDVFDLADIHASSRLQFDECQQDHAAMAPGSSSSRNPLYFC